MKKGRRLIHPRILAAESAAIMQFLFDVGEPEPGAKIPLKDIFERYHDWRKEMHMTESVLTVDGFGRLFPHSYSRGSSYWIPAKHTLKCVFGLKLK